MARETKVIPGMGKKIRVVHFTNHYWPCVGGIEQFTQELAEQTKKLGLHSSVVCLDKCHASEKKFKASETHNGIPIHRVRFLDLKYYKIAPKIFRFVEDADVLHVHGVGFFSDYLALTKPWHGKPLVLSTHGGIFHTKKLGAIKKAYFFGAQKIALNAFEAVVAVSEKDQRLFGGLVSPKKLHLIENAIDLNRFHIGKKKKNSFLFVGRLSKNKRLDNLLESFSILKKNGLNFSLRIVGEDWEGLKDSLEKRLDSFGLKKFVEFIGNCDEKKKLALFRESEFFVSASEYEGFGISLIEAMASGCIPIVNTIESFEDFVSSGMNGFLTRFSEPNTAAKELKKAMSLKEPQKAKIRKSALGSVQRFGWEKAAPKWVRLYESVAR